MHIESKRNRIYLKILKGPYQLGSFIHLIGIWNSYSNSYIIQVLGE